MMRIAYLLILSSALSWAQSPEIKEGDFIFQNLNCGPMCEAINEVTFGYEGQNFNHIGLVLQQEGALVVIEANWPKVRLVSLENFLEYTPNPQYLGRLKEPFQHLIPEAISFSLKQLGKPYDRAFLYDNDAYYCSELIYDAFKAAHGAPVFQLYPMTYKSPDSDDFFPIWIEYYNQLGVAIPEGLPGCNPAGMSLSDKLDILGIIKKD